MKKDRPKKGAFLKILNKKIAFFRRALPLKISIYWCKGAFRNILGSVTKNGYLKIIQRGKNLAPEFNAGADLGGGDATPPP